MTTASRTASGPVCALVLALASTAFCALPASASSEELLKSAKADFMSYCASCHGREGTGDGPVAEALKVRPADLTQLSTASGGTFPSADIYDRIDGTAMPRSHGTRRMPVWGRWFTQEEAKDSLLTGDKAPLSEKVAKRIEGLVAYIKSIQR